MEKKTDRVLFTCVGTSDPVRGEHDGPAMHILRKYRPSYVCIFFSEEISDFETKDQRFDKTFAWMKEMWNYSPEREYIHSGIKNVYDLDTLEEPMYAAMTDLAARFPDAEILVNLTSGTPQMQMLLAQMVMERRFRATGVQVPNPEGKSGRTTRTNDPNYDVELELMCDKDEEPGAKDRNQEPKMFAIRRSRQKEQILTLLDKRDFPAILAMGKDALPPNLLDIVRHLEARSRLELTEAKRCASRLELDFPLFPYKDGDRAAYEPMAEYFLLLKNLVAAGRYTEFVVRMEPLLLNLQKSLLDQFLRQRGYSLADLLIIESNNREVFDPALLLKQDESLYRKYVNWVDRQNKNWKADRRDLNIYIADALLSFFDHAPESYGRVFAAYEKLKAIRNRIAHQFYVTTQDEIKSVTGYEPDKLIQDMGNLVKDCFTACDPRIFRVYEDCIAYIKARY